MYFSYLRKKLRNDDHPNNYIGLTHGWLPQVPIQLSVIALGFTCFTYKNNICEIL